MPRGHGAGADRARQAAARLVKAVEKAGGEQREYDAPKPWQMPKWAVERAREEGLRLDQEAAKALVAVRRHAPAAARARGREARDRRAPAHAAHRRRGRRAGRGRVHPAGATTSPTPSWPATRPRPGARGAAHERGEHRPSKLVFPIVRRLRDVHRAAELLDAGVPEAQGGVGAMKMPPWAAKRDARPGEEGRSRACSPARCARSPTSRSSCAAAEAVSTRTRPSA